MTRPARLTKTDWKIINSALSVYEIEVGAAPDQHLGVDVDALDERARVRTIARYFDQLAAARAKVHQRLSPEDF